MSTVVVVVIVIVVIVALGAVAFVARGQARRRGLQQRFGPEYDRTVETADGRREAERELAQREKRHASFDLRPLSADERERYTREWADVQERFVDEPGDALLEADELVHTVMRDRGYPTDGFEQQAADLSVEHAAVISHYRDGYHIRTRHDRAEATTEDLRQALVHYRTMFRELIGKAEPTKAEPRAEVPAAREAIDDSKVDRDEVDNMRVNR